MIYFNGGRFIILIGVCINKLNSCIVVSRSIPDCVIYSLKFLWIMQGTFLIKLSYLNPLCRMAEESVHCKVSSLTTSSHARPPLRSWSLHNKGLSPKMKFTLAWMLVKKRVGLRGIVSRNLWSISLSLLLSFSHVGRAFFVFSLDPITNSIFRSH